MTEALRICAAALTVAVCGFLLRELGWRGAVSFSVVCAVIFLSFLSDGLSEMSKWLGSISKYGEIGAVAKEILKVTGVSYIFGVCSDIATELGEKSIATALTVVGRVEILLISMPYFFKIMEYAVALVGV